MRIVVSYGYDTDSKQFYCPASDDDGDALAAPLAAGHAADKAGAKLAAAGNYWLCTEYATDQGNGFRLAGTTEHTLENVANRTAAALTTRAASEIPE
jgi:hypothetical protein